jgi:hypothetical protein
MGSDGRQPKRTEGLWYTIEVDMGWSQVQIPVKRDRLQAQTQGYWGVMAIASLATPSSGAGACDMALATQQEQGSHLLPRYICLAERRTMRQPKLGT